MKAGTTTLFDHLAGHPAVAASSDKEPKYFAWDSVYERGPDWYASLWDWDPATHSIAMEASTHYSFRHEHPETAARMAAHPGEFRLVYLVREPVARVESHYHHALAAGWRVADRPLGVPIHPDLVDPCRYAWQLDAYTEQFPRESILVLSFEELVADTEGTVERVLEHWGLPTEGFSMDTGLVRNSSSGKVVSTRWTRPARCRAPRGWPSVSARLPPEDQGPHRIRHEGTPPRRGRSRRVAGRAGRGPPAARRRVGRRRGRLAGGRLGRDGRQAGTDSSAHTTLPGSFQVTPHRSAMWSTMRRPRPESLSPAGGRRHGQPPPSSDTEIRTESTS